MVGPRASFGKILFSGDGTAFMTGMSLWSLLDEQVLTVGRALIDFTTALNRGGYDPAAGFYQPDEWAISNLASLGMTTNDLSVLLEFACTQDFPPCMPIQEILYAGEEFLGDYGLLVRFTAPDGSSFVD